MRASRTLVRSDCKGQGLGRLLLDQLVRYARAEGTQVLIGVVLRGNTEMPDLARECGFTRHPLRPAEDDVVHLSLPLTDAGRRPLRNEWASAPRAAATNSALSGGCPHRNRATPVVRRTFRDPGSCERFRPPDRQSG